MSRTEDQPSDSALAEVRRGLQEGRDRTWRTVAVKADGFPGGNHVPSSDETEREVAVSNVNTVVVSGNLTRDPEVRWTSDDGESMIVNVGIAVNRSRKNADGEYEDEVSFFDADVFGGFAKLVGRKLKKGDSATIQGRLEQQRWEDGDGNTKSKVVIIATQIDSEGFFRSKDEDNDLATASSASASTAEAEALAAEPKLDDIPF